MIMYPKLGSGSGAQRPDWSGAEWAVDADEPGIMIGWVEEGGVPTMLNATHLTGSDVGKNAQICA